MGGGEGVGSDSMGFDDDCGGVCVSMVLLDVMERVVLCCWSLLSDNLYIIYVIIKAYPHKLCDILMQLICI